VNLIVSVCRALANRLRLHLLLTVYSSPGLSVAQIADRVGRPISAVSRHLRQLGQYQMVEARPSGRHVYYHPPKPGSTRSEFLTGLQKLLTQTLVAGRLNCTLAQVCNDSEKPSSRPNAASARQGRRRTPVGKVCPGWEPVFQEMIRCFTAYTHLRRLLCLRLMLQGKRLVQAAMRTEIGMSVYAVSRQTRKLTRRGVLRPCKDEDGWELDVQRSRKFQQALFDLVKAALKRE